ncbi:hypothetical protein BD779DRAFT_1667443 [Infundibulicybe gibba]|nr:hypothetical protein BD779DRAFT_1667443 [Infundibulicybe gibba]
MSPSSASLNVPVFAGQGTAAANNALTRQQAVHDASTPAGSLLLSSCFEAFHHEISSLSPEELSRLGLDLSDFTSEVALLQIPPEKYCNDPVITGPTLFLIQSLRYIAFVAESGVSNKSLTPFSDVLKQNSTYGMGVLGFSSGILPACVVGTSLTTVSYITRAVEAYRLSIWIGIRTQIYRANTSIDIPTLPWSLVFLGMSKKSAEEAIATFTEINGESCLFVTAVVDDACVTVSGHPDVLESFSTTVPAGTVIHKTAVDTLYHSPIHATGAREHVLADVIRRNIQFPDFQDIKVPIRSSFTGKPLNRETQTSSLVELVVDMLLTQPVNWDLVVSELVSSTPPDVPHGRSFPQELVSSVDLSIARPKPDGFKPKQEPIAIVGMAVHMPGARSPSELWQVLEQGINTISEVPEHRFKVTNYNNPKDPNSKRQMKAHTGNFIDGVDEFDNKFFKISPREAKSMDPQQRVLLHTAYHALENSGFVPNATPTTNPDTFGCYIGVATHDYLQNLRDEIDVYYSTGTLKAFLSGRISYAMQFSGPSIVVDTACSSSAVAVYQGCRALMNGDCNSALVGGVNVISSPDMMLGLDRGHFLSPTGQCKAFDTSADGYSRSEGCGIFVIKRLSDAISENDNILGVIRGIEVNQSGLAHSITHPHAPTQATLFKRVLSNTGIDPNRVSVVEAHGTGTQAGDPNELESIRSIFAIQRSSDNPLHVTSVKANIGHLEAASGVAGLAKLLLMLRHRSIPRVISLKNLNPKIAPLESDNTVIDTIQVPWTTPNNQTRIALLNNFGAAGSNTAMLIEEFVPQPITPSATTDGSSLVFGLSAKTDEALETLRSRYLAWLESSECDARLSDIAYTMTARRQIFSYRISVQASSKAELVEKLRKAPAVKSSDEDAKVVFVFSGQGSQYLGMGQSLYHSSSLFKQHINTCHNILVEAGFPGILPIILAGEGGSGLSALEEFEAYQAAVLSLELALAQLWLSWGIIPAAVVGTEYAALVVAGVLSLKDTLMLVAKRVRFMTQSCAVETTGMIAVNLAANPLNEALRSSPTFSSLTIACYNSASDCTVSGPLEQLKLFKVYLDNEVHCKNVLLSVPFGYHSPAMNPLVDDLTRAARQATLQPPAIPIVSNVLGQVVLPGDSTIYVPEYFARHCVEPVQFHKGICSLTEIPSFRKVGAWLEIGPHPSSLPMLKSNAMLSKDTLLLGSLRKQQDSWSTLAASFSQIYLSGISLKWREIFSHIPSVICIDLPAYPFAKTKFWAEYKENIAAPAQTTAAVAPVTNLIHDFKMLHSWIQYPSGINGNVAIFETPISELADSIRGHSVGGVPLCPASVYLEQVLAGINLGLRHLGIDYSGNQPVLHKIEFARPLVYDAAVARTVITSISLDDGFGVFSVSSRVDSSEESVHMHGQYRFQSSPQIVTKFTHALPSVTRQIVSVVNNRSGDSEVFSTRTAYEVIFPRVVDYAKEYHTMRSLTIDASGMEGCADVRLPSDYDKGKFVAHPVFMDTLLHVAGFVANMQGGANDAYICSEVGTVKAIPELIDNNASYLVYCNNVWLADEGIMLAEAYALLADEPKRIVAHLKGMHFQKVRLNSLKKGLALAAGKPTTHRPVIPPPVRRQMATPTKPIPQTNTPQDVQSKIVKLVSETCDTSPENIDIKTDLGSLGVDSLMSIEIFGKLQESFPGTDLNAQTLSFCRNIVDIVSEVSNKLGSSMAAPSPPVSSQPATISEALSRGPDIRALVSNIISETCDIDLAAINIDTDLGSLGVDSLMSIEIFGRMQEAFPRENLDAHALSSCSTVADIVRQISKAVPLNSGYNSSGSSSPRTLAAADEHLSEPKSIPAGAKPDVKSLLASVLDVNVNDISDDADFESLGLDSLTSIEALGALKDEFGLDLPGNFFTAHPTARTVQTYLSQQLRV